MLVELKSFFFSFLFSISYQEKRKSELFPGYSKPSQKLVRSLQSTTIRDSPIDSTITETRLHMTSR